MLSKDPNDPLDELFGGAASTAPRVVTPPASYQPQDFSEPCRKCGGTGRYRHLGPCFACKGKGKFSFKTAPEQRAKALVQAAQRKERTATEAVDAFKGEHPAVWAWMEGSTFPFAVSLAGSLVKYGSLTPNQLAAAYRSIEKRDAARTAGVQRVTEAPSIDVDKIADAFSRATQSGLNRPRLRIGAFAFSPAKASSKNAGSIYVKQGETYLGRVTGGKFICTRECGDARRDEVIAIAADPKAAASVHGKLTGNCSCCGRLLTDPVSVANGIGPICASNYGW